MLLKSLLLFPLIALSSFSWATSYSRGNYKCNNFEEAEQRHQEDPDSIDLEIRYAKCLIFKGEDDRGLRKLYQIVETKNHVMAAFHIAQYIKSGGKLNGIIEYKNINKSIEAFQRVLFLIDLDRSYPSNGHEIYENSYQIELFSHFYVSLLYLQKYEKGFISLYNYQLLQSPNYTGDRDLIYVQEYMPYTMDSLNKAVEFASRCHNLPKKPYFNSEKYPNFMKACRIIKDSALAILPLEERRLTLLNSESCQDITQCPDEFNELTQEVFSKSQTAHKKAVAQDLALR